MPPGDTKGFKGKEGKYERGKLNDQQWLFVKEYLVDFSGSAAARRAGYSDQSAAGAAWRLMRTPAVQEAIDAELEKLGGVAEVTKKRIVSELEEMTIADRTEILAQDQTVRPPEQWSSGNRKSVQSMEVHELPDGGGRIVKVKFIPKEKVLEMLMKHHGLLRDKVEHTGADGEPLQIIINTIKPEDK